jgi:hypothetical protein
LCAVTVYDTVRVTEQSSGKGIYSTNHALWHQVLYRFTLPILPLVFQGILYQLIIFQNTRCYALI